MIFFDLDGTLFDDRGAQEQAALRWLTEVENLYVSQSRADWLAEWHAASLRHWAAYEREEISWADQHRSRVRDVLHQPLLSDARADDLFERYLTHYEANWRLFPDVTPALELLASHRLGILTHGEPMQQERKLARFNLTSRFEIVVVLDGVSPRKYSPDTFEMAARKAGVNGSECMYIGDHLQNEVLAARAAGWRGVWLERSEMLLAPDGIERLTSLLDTPFLLAKTRN